MKLRAKDPRKIGPYQIEARIGSGGMGVVFLGSHQGKKVAVKTVRTSFLDDPSLKSRFQREIANLKVMNSPRIAKYLDSAILDEEIAWHAVEYVDGPNLSELVKAKGPLPEDQWWAVAAELIETLRYLEGLGIVHRDIKPSNIIMSEEGISLIDFGISQDSDSTSITSTGMLSGSPAWLAPEQLEGTKLSSASDWFSAGSVLVFAAKGKSPWGNETSMTIPVLYQKILSASPNLSGLSEEQRSLVEGLLDPNPKNRKLPKSLPKFSGAAGTSTTSKKSSTPSKKTSRQPAAAFLQFINASSLKFTVAMVLMFLFGGALALSQVPTVFPEQVASEPSQAPKATNGLASRDFAPGDACGDFEIAAVKLISSMEQADKDLGTSNWGTVGPPADDAIVEYFDDVNAIPEGELPEWYVSENLAYADELAWKLLNLDPASTDTFVRDQIEYIKWESHVVDFFKPLNWCE